MSVKMKISLNILLVLFFLGLMTISQFAQRNPYENQLRLAKSFEDRGELEEAEKIYYEVHNKQPQNYQLYQPLYKVLVSQKKYLKAIDLVKKQLSASKNKVALYGDLGSVYYLMGNEKMAFDAWNDALKLEPENPFAYRNIANYLIENRLIEKAIEVLKIGNELADDKTMFSYDIANLYSITMKYDEATKEYCRILAQKPTQINTIKNMILSYINANQAAGPTIKTVEEIYEEEGSTFYLHLLSDLYLKVGENSKALEAIEKYESETTRNGTAIFTDTFSYGNPPPSAPDFLNGNPASYFVRGAMGPESGGKLTLNSADADPGISALGDPFLFQAATLLTDTNSSDLTTGLKIDDALSVSGVFDLFAPTVSRESYGVNYSDRATGMGLPEDDIVGLRVY